jgi:N-hydroxyarylamine O-acetyltransferase
LYEVRLIFALDKQHISIILFLDFNKNLKAHHNLNLTKKAKYIINKMNVDEYLKRFNSCNYKEVSVHNLFKLQYNHLLNIPFENLDMHIYKHNNKPNDGDNATKSQSEDINDEFTLENLYDKIVKRKRGGMCCELNYLFYWLLKELGYQVSLLSCRAFRVETNQWTPWNGHLSLMVQMNDSNFIVDVGFNKNFRTPLKFLVDHVQQDITGYYNIIKDDEHEDAYLIIKCFKEDIRNINQWAVHFKFSVKSKTIEDFIPMINFVKSKDNDRFSERSICIIHTTYSVLNLVGFRLSEIIYSNSTEKSKTHSILNKKEVLEAIKNLYGIECDEFEPKGD